MIGLWLHNYLEPSTIFNVNLVDNAQHEQGTFHIEAKNSHNIQVGNPAILFILLPEGVDAVINFLRLYHWQINQYTTIISQQMTRKSKL